MEYAIFEIRENTYNNKINKIQSQLNFIINVVQPFFSKGDTSNDCQLLLWINKRKKAINVIKMMDIRLQKKK